MTNYDAFVSVLSGSIVKKSSIKLCSLASLFFLLFYSDFDRN